MQVEVLQNETVKLRGYIDRERAMHRAEADGTRGELQKLQMV